MPNALSYRRARVLWGGLEARVDTPMPMAFHRLYRAYGARSRAYHGRGHVVDVVLRAANASRRLDARAQAALIAAAWYHDVVYDARRHDNEARSAAVMRRELRRHGVDKGIIDEAARLILQTVRHTPRRLDTAAQILVDADLATLSAVDARYDAYSASIRHEYAWVPEPAYRQGRAAVLRRFLGRPVIYHTRVMRRREAAARANISREIESLES